MDFTARQIRRMLWSYQHSLSTMTKYEMVINLKLLFYKINVENDFYYQRREIIFEQRVESSQSILRQSYVEWLKQNIFPNLRETTHDNYNLQRNAKNELLK